MTLRASLTLVLATVLLPCCIPKQFETPDQAPDTHWASPVQDPYPIIMWGVEPTYTKTPSVSVPDDLGALSAAGFTWVHTYGGVKFGGSADSIRAFLDALDRQGLRVIASVERLLDGRIDTAFARSVITRWKGHPAIGAWQAVDEPDVKGVTPRDLLELYRLIRLLDPARPVVVVWANHPDQSEFESVGRIFDWGMINVYPISVARGYDRRLIPSAVRRFKNAIQVDRRPLTPILQTFGDRRYALPTDTDLSDMLAQFRAAGATGGVAFYAWNVPGNPVPLAATPLWRSVQSLVDRLTDRVREH